MWRVLPFGATPAAFSIIIHGTKRNDTMAKKQFNSLGFMLKKMAAVTVYLISELAESVQEALTEFGASGTNHSSGLVPDPGSTQGTTKFLREDGTWAVPAGPDISGKEDVTAIQAVASGTTLTAAFNTYYRFDYDVGTLGITLPSVSGVTRLKGIVFSFTTGSTPAVTFTSTGNVSIEYQAYYAISANTKYEINAIYNGSKWIIAYATIG